MNLVKMIKRILFFSVLILSVSMFKACKENTFQEGTLSPYITVFDVKKLYKGSDVTLTSNNLGGARAVRGLVIADSKNDNSIDGSIIIQGYKLGNLRGIILNFQTDVEDVNVGDSIAVNIENAVLKSYNGAIVIENINKEKIVKLKTGLPVIPTLLTSSQLTASAKDYESTLVKVVSNTLVGNFVPTNRYGGNHVFNDGTLDLTIHALQGGDLSTKNVAASASFTGIPSFYYDPAESANDGAMRLWPRDYDDVTDESGPIYANFPETFESYKVGSISTLNVTYTSGIWFLQHGITGDNKTHDRQNPNGKYSIRLDRNLSVSSLLEMKFDVPNGAQKVTFLYGATSTDDPSTFRLEYSINQGVTWLPVGDDVYVDQRVATLATYSVDFSVPVRFRINKLGLGPSTISVKNGRLNIDDFAVYTRIN